MSNKKTNRESINNIFSAIMSEEFRVGYRRRLVAINRVKLAIMKSIFEKQEEIKNKHCR